MRTAPTDVQVLAALSLAVAAAVISTPGYSGGFAKVHAMLLEAVTEPDTTTLGYNPTGVALPP